MITIVDLGLAYAVVIGASMAIRKFRERTEGKIDGQAKSAASSGVAPAHGPARTEPTLGPSAAAELHDEAHAREMRSIPDADDEEDLLLIGNDQHRDD